MQIDLGLAIAVGSAILGIYTGIIVLLIKWLLKSHESRLSDKFRAFDEKIDAANNRATTEAKRVEAIHIAYKEHADGRLNNLFDKYDKLIDKWEKFLENYYKIDTTRSNRLDAAFRLIDEMKNIMYDIKPLVSKKIDETTNRIYEDLKAEIKSSIKRGGEGT